MKNLILFFTTVLLLSGCSLFETNTEMNKSVDELVSEGSSAFMAGEYKTAIKAYTDLKDWYPFSKYAVLAELKIADSYYHLESYEEAILAYEEFERMHPKNEAIPYVVFQIGMCWFNQIGTIDRDDTPAQKSLAIFKRLVNQYPTSEYADKTKDKMKSCLANMSAHELYVGNWYMKTQKYDAALNRYEYLVANYPDSKETKEALAKIPQCRALAKKK
ncbi:MAG: outer membrane protein assembly factor BamD [Pseudomonadota bacterium]